MMAAWEHVMATSLAVVALFILVVSAVLAGGRFPMSGCEMLVSGIRILQCLYSKCKPSATVDGQNPA